MRLTRNEYGNQRSALRQTLRHLNALLEQQLVVQLERRVGGWQGGSAVTIWTLTTKGLRHLTGSSNRLRPLHHSTTFLEHLLAISETRVILHEATELHNLHIRIESEPHCWRAYLDAQGQTTTLKPDLALTVLSEQFMDRYFFEIDRATENPARVIRKCWQYAHHRRSGAEQEQHEVYPAVLWLVPHSKRKEQLLRGIAVEPRLPRELFTVITPDELTTLIKNGPGGNP